MGRFLESGFWNGLDRGDAPGASRDALYRGRPYYLGPGLQCLRAGADRQQGYGQSCYYDRSLHRATMGWHLGPATPLLHKVRAEVDGEQVTT